jgi:type IV pilus assembly protein PilC
VVVTRVQRRWWAVQPQVSRHALVVFTRQLATMTRAGLPLLQALDLIGSGLREPALQRTLRQVRHDVATGQPLSRAMAQHPACFPALYCRMVAVGETSGTLERTLERLAVQQEKALAVRRQIRAALLYPVAVMAVALAVVAVMMAVVVPTFEGVFASFGAQLPLATRMVVWASEAVVAWWAWALATLGLGACALRALVRRSEGLQYRMDATLLALPLVGELLGKALVARWARTLATLFGAGITLVEALGSVASVAGNRVFSQATRQVQQAVSNGQRMTQAMDRAGVFPPLLLQMASIGEESGTLEQMMGKTADFFEAEVDEGLKGLSSLLEPLLIVVLGGLIGGIVVALYLPIFQIGTVA